MEIKPGTPHLVRDYLPKYRRAIILWYTLSILLLLSTIAVIAVGPLVSSELVAIYLIAGVCALLTIASLIVAFIKSTTPVKILTNTLAHVSGEQISGPLLHPNDTKSQKNGLSPLLQTIFELGATSSISPKSTEVAKVEVDLAAMLESATTGIIGFNSTGTIVYANKLAPVSETSDGKKQLDLIFDVDESIETWIQRCHDSAVRDTKTWRRVANKLVGAEGRKIYDISASYEKGRPVEIVIALIERTADYISSDDELDFISFAAHELRGPITVIRGYLDTLHDELGDRLQNDETILFERLIVSANRLSGYINNILNAAKFDRRHLNVHLREDTLHNVYQTIQDDMALRASAQRRLLTVSFPPELPTVAVDRSSMSEVIANLIDNAIKYSNEGGAISVTAQATTNNQIEITITDSGIGMPANVVKNLFHKFYRSHRSRETVAGTGIGLYICKAIVETHGGTITVRSVEGEGSVFTVTLPTYAAVADKLKASNNSSEGLIRSGDGWIKNHGTFRG